MPPRLVRPMLSLAVLTAACVSNEPTDPGPRSCGEPSEPCVIGDECIQADDLAPMYVQIVLDIIAEYDIADEFMITGFERVEVSGDPTGYYPRLSYRYTIEGFDHAGVIARGKFTLPEWEVFMREVLSGVIAGPLVDDATVEAAVQSCLPDAAYSPCEHDVFDSVDGQYRPYAFVIVFESCIEYYARVDLATGELLECSESTACDNDS